MKITHEYNPDTTVACYHDLDGLPMSSRIPGILNHREVSNFLAYCRKNDRAKLPLLEGMVEAIKKPFFRVIK